MCCKGGGSVVDQDRDSTGLAPGNDVVMARQRAAKRALAEAAARRMERENPVSPPEIGGRDGLEPVRFGDWEVKGLASDF